MALAAVMPAIAGVSLLNAADKQAVSFQLALE